MKIGPSPIEQIMMESGAPFPTLLQLPIEVFQLIQYHMDGATFLISLLTCKYFYRAAASDSLLRSHLRRLPDTGRGNQAPKVEDLRSLFQQYAAESCQAAGVLADVCQFIGDGRCLMSQSRASGGDETTLAVPFRDGTIQLFEVTRKSTRKRELLEIHRDHEFPGEIQILKLAFAPGTKDLAVLCTQECYSPEIGKYSCRIGSNWEWQRNYITNKLVVFHRIHTKLKGYFYSTSVQEIRDVEFMREPKVVDLALSPTGLACITWTYQDRNRRNWPAEEALTWLVHRNTELMEACQYDPYPRLSPVIPTTHPMHGLFLAAAFRDDGKVLDLFSNGYAVPSYQVELRDGDHPISNVASTNFHSRFDRDEHRYSCVTGRFFYSKHKSDVLVDFEDEPCCQWSELAIVRTIRNPTYAVPCVFIALRQTFQDPSVCNHQSNSGRTRLTTDSTPLALLAGFRDCPSSLGTIMAISPHNRRVAAAMWNRIYLWSFNPDRLINEIDSYFPSRDWNQRKGYGRLRPTLLSSSAGVVHSLFWTGDETLFAITDRGLTKYDMHALCDGQRWEMSLMWDTWSTTALNEPAPGSGKDHVPATIAHNAHLFDEND